MSWGLAARKKNREISPPCFLLFNNPSPIAVCVAAWDRFNASEFTVDFYVPFPGMTVEFPAMCLFDMVGIEISVESIDHAVDIDVHGVFVDIYLKLRIVEEFGVR